MTIRKQMIKDAWERYRALQAAYIDIVNGTAKQYSIDGRVYTAFNLDEMGQAMDRALLDVTKAIRGSSITLSQVVPTYK